MSDNTLQALDPFAPIQSGSGKPNPRMGIGFFDDLNFENAVAEAPVQITKAGAGIFGDLADLFKEEIAGLDKSKLAIGGKTEMRFDSRVSVDQQQEQEKKEEAIYKKDFYQKLDSDRKNLEHRGLEQVMEDLVRLEVGAMSADEKNKTLHLSADLDERNIRDPYHLHALRVKKMEQIKQALQDKKSEEMAAQTPNLTLRLDANEGQSMVSQSGAIMSAG